MNYLLPIAFVVVAAFLIIRATRQTTKLPGNTGGTGTGGGSLGGYGDEDRNNKNQI